MPGRMEKNDWYCAQIELPPDLMARANELARQAANHPDLSATIDELIEAKLKNWGGTKPGAVGFTWDVIKHLAGDDARELLVYTDPIVANWRDGKNRPGCIDDINQLCRAGFRAAMPERTEGQEESPDAPASPPVIEPVRLTEEELPAAPSTKKPKQKYGGADSSLPRKDRNDYEEDLDKEGPF